MRCISSGLRINIAIHTPMRPSSTAVQTFPNCILRPWMEPDWCGLPIQPCSLPRHCYPIAHNDLVHHFLDLISSIYGASQRTV